MSKHLKSPIRVPLESLHLDPNNPRLGREELPGYESPSKLFDAKTQAELEAAMKDVYEIEERLVTAILGQGWIPVDPIMVWEHPKKAGHYVVVEGNSRLTALRHIHKRYEAEKEILEKHKKRKVDEEVIKEQRAVLRQYEDVVKATETLEVFPVKADTAQELGKILPSLLGARHITHAQQWKPYATNLYIYSEYMKRYRQQYPDRPPAIDRQIVKDIADLVSLTPLKTRRNIQAAAAFNHFKARYEDKLPDDEKFLPEDHYFFENILVNNHAKREFRFHDDVLWLDKEMEEVLFKWAFSKPRNRNDVDDNENILRKAEDIRLWSQIARYDEKNRTMFATRLNVNAPDEASSIAAIEADFLKHKLHRSPVDLMQELLEELEKLPAESLRARRKHVEPMLKQLQTLSADYLRMLKSVAA